MKKEIKIKCLKCNSENLRLEKWVFGNKKNRWIKRAKVICLRCNYRQALKITEQIYELTRKLRWRHKNKKPPDTDTEGIDYILLTNSK